MNNSKKIISLLLSLIMALSVFTIVPFSVSAEGVDAAPTGATADEAYRDFKYEAFNDGTAEITGYIGSGGDVTIPSTIGGYTVTSIGNRAFSGCKWLTSVVIGNSVTIIGWYAFKDCTGLTSVVIGNSVTIIGREAFYGCTGLTSVVIPDSVTLIDSYAFEGCTGLTSVKVSEGNSVYDSRNNCNAIIETESNTLIYGCKNTVIPDSVTSIGGYAFEGCTGLTSVVIPDSVTSIGSRAFRNCTGLTSVVIPDSVTSIGGWAFEGCTGLTSVVIPDSVTSIGEGAFFDCTGLTSVVIPDSVTSIDDWAFYGCTGLTSVVIGDSVTSIGDYAFLDCTGLTSVVIPDSLTRPIGWLAFGYYYDETDETKTYRKTYHKVDGFTIYGHKGTFAENYAKEYGFIFSEPPVEKTDKDTKIIISVPADTEIKAEKINNKETTEAVKAKLPESSSIVAVYDIELTKNGELTQPESAVTVKIPCDNPDANVYRLESDGALTDMNAVYKDGYMVFATDHFSTYILAETKADNGATVKGTVTSFIDEAEVTVKLTGTDNDFTATVTGTADYAIEDVPEGEYTLTVSKKDHVTREYTVTVSGDEVTQDVKINPVGDVNGDGSVSIADYSRINKHVCKVKAISGYESKCADVNGDGNVSIADLSRVNKHVCKVKKLW